MASQDSESREPSAGPDRPAANEPRRRPGFVGERAWTWLAWAVFVLLTLVLFRGLLGHDPTRFVPANVVAEARDSRGEADWDSLAETDLRFVVWLVTRNAWTLSHRPARLFDAEQCYPAQNSLAFGESGIALGLLATPLRLVLRDPIATFNATLVAMTLIAALAMFLLVREWTGVPAAAIVAAILYAFHFLKTGDIVHILIWDTSWTVFALLFALRLFAHGRWSDAILLALAIALQVAGSIYTLLAALVIGLPFAIWLIVRYGMSHVQPAQLGLVAGSLVLSGLLFLGPYFQLSADDGLGAAPYKVFLSLAYVLPGGVGFSGWCVLLLCVAALAFGRPVVRARIGADPRWVLLGSAIAIFCIAVVGEGGPGQPTVGVVRGDAPPEGFPNLYFALSRFVPALEVVRGPGAMYSGVHLLLCVLAGLGAAVVLRYVPRRYFVPTAVGLALLASVDTFRPRLLGLEPRIDYSLVDVSPDPEALALFAALDDAGNDGPLLEYPVNSLNLYKASTGLLLTSYHHRPTSYCYNSHRPQALAVVESLATALPEPTALTQLRELGFGTVVVHHRAGELLGDAHRRAFERFAAGEGQNLLTKIAGNAAYTAYGIAP
jgi:hypothetical protein